MRRLPIYGLLALLLLGSWACQSSDEGELLGHDIRGIQDRVKLGMTEFQATTAADAAPDAIKTEGDVRRLRYKAAGGGSTLVMTFTKDRLTEMRVEKDP